MQDQVALYSQFAEYERYQDFKEVIINDENYLKGYAQIKAI